MRRFVVLSEAQATAVTLWVAHSHAVAAFDVTPFLAITSPEKRCGKSRLLEILELLVFRPWSVIMPSEAVLFRKIAGDEPTLLLDETDAIFNARTTNTEPLRAVLNAGNRRGTSVPRCVGPTHQVVEFPVFCAKALAGIGNLPDTITDRAITIRMTRKRPDEIADRFRFREAQLLAEPLRGRLAAWSDGSRDGLEAARPAVPSVLDDRAEEAWEPLLAIADLAGGMWPERARRAALQLSGADARDDEALGVKLLADIRDAFASAGADRLSSATLAARLCENEESPWGDLWGRQLDPRGLARRLKPFAVKPRTVRFDDDTTAKGYHLEQFQDAFSRYLGGSIRHNVTSRMNTGAAAAFEPSQKQPETGRRPAWANDCDVATDGFAHGARRRPRFGEAGYAMFVDRAHTKGHITSDELSQLLNVDAYLSPLRRRVTRPRDPGDLHAGAPS